MQAKNKKQNNYIGNVLSCTLGLMAMFFLLRCIFYIIDGFSANPDEAALEVLTNASSALIVCIAIATFFSTNMLNAHLRPFRILKATVRLLIRQRQSDSPHLEEVAGSIKTLCEDDSIMSAHYVEGYLPQRAKTVSAAAINGHLGNYWPDIGLYINEHSVFDAALPRRVAEFIPSVFTAMGILGTFIGLVISLNGASDVIAGQSENVSIITETIFTGLRTAYFTSIWGVICSLLWSSADRWLSHRRIRTIHRFQNEFAKHFQTLSQDAVMDILAVEQNAQMNNLQASVAESLRDEFRSAMQGLTLNAVQAELESSDPEAPGRIAHLMTVFQYQVGVLERLSGQLVMSQDEVLNNMTRQFLQALREEREREKEHMATFYITAQEYAQACQLLLKESSDTASEAVMKTAKLYKEHTRAIDETRAAVGRLNAAMQPTMDLVQQWKENNQEFSQHIANTHEQLDVMRRDNVALAMHTGNSAKELVEIEQRVKGLSDRLESFAQRIESSGVQITSSFLKMGNVVTNEAVVSSEAVNKLLGEMQKAAAEMRSGSEIIHGNMESVERVLAQFLHEMQGVMRRYDYTRQERWWDIFRLWRR